MRACVCVRRERETCNDISSKTLEKKFEPLIIDCLATIEWLSLKSVKKTGISTDECSIAFNPISSTNLPAIKTDDSWKIQKQT